MRRPRPDARIVLLGVILAILAVGALYVVTRPHEVGQAEVTVDAGRTYQTINGFGAETRTFDDPHVFDNYDAVTKRAATTLTPAQEEAILDKLYVTLGLTRVRPVSPDVQGAPRGSHAHAPVTHPGAAAGSGGDAPSPGKVVPSRSIEPVNDNADPYRTDLAKFNFRWKNLDAHCMYIKQAQRLGARTFFLSPLNRETWIDVHSMRDVPEYAEWLLAQVMRCRQLGVTFRLLSPVNEPSYNRNTMNADFIRGVIKNLGPRLMAAGFDIKFVIPDDVRSTDGAAKAERILSDPVARRYVGVLSTHLYDEPVVNIRKLQRLSRQYGLPLWMTEFSSNLAPTSKVSTSPLSYAKLINDLIGMYGVSAIDYQWGFFGQWEKNTQLIVLNSDRQKRYTGYTLTKQYYLTGQYSRFVRPGSRRIQAQADDADVRVTAYTKAGRLVIVALNLGNRSTSQTFRIKGMTGIARMRPIRTDRGPENWKRLPDVGVKADVFDAVLPPGSVTTFVSR